MTPPLMNAQLDELTAYPARLDPIYETVRKVKAQLDPTKTLIGFAGSPWTVATYMVAGQGSRDQSEARHLAYADPGAFGAIVERIKAVTLDYLSGQAAAGGGTPGGGSPQGGTPTPVVTPGQNGVTKPTHKKKHKKKHHKKHKHGQLRKPKRHHPAKRRSVSAANTAEPAFTG